MIDLSLIYLIYQMIYQVIYWFIVIISDWINVNNSILKNFEYLFHFSARDCNKKNYNINPKLTTLSKLLAT